MVSILLFLFILSLSVAIVVETIDSINKARGKPTNYAKVLGYISNGFEGVCVLGMILAAFGLVISLCFLIINLMIDFISGVLV